MKIETLKKLSDAEKEELEKLKQHCPTEKDDERKLELEVRDLFWNVEC